MSDHCQLNRIERKLDLMLRLQGCTLEELAELQEDKKDDAKELALIAKLKASADKLNKAVQANQP